MLISNASGLSRRKFIKGGLYALGGCVALDAGLLKIAMAATPAAGQWPYAILDPVAVGQSAWNPPDCHGCGGQSLGAIVYALQAALGPGSPWDDLPKNLGAFGNGGGPQRQTCGAVIGPYFVMSLVGADKALGKMFYQWYCDTNFPSTEWDNFVPGSGTAPLTTDLRTVSASTLCSVSRDTWEKEYSRIHPEANIQAQSRDRCTKVICDCTRKAVELLNAWKSGEIQEETGGAPGGNHQQS
jgi:hypothetical protein